MNVGDDRHARGLDDGFQAGGGGFVGARNPDDIGARLFCAIVAAASEVSVLVMDCTLIGASPPTSTAPTRIFRDLRLTMSR
jgi:hypothetical protein